MSFESLGLSQPILRAIADAGYTQPTPIQLQAIPAVLSGKDLLAGAQTGTGKTAGFTLPILHKLSSAAAQVAPAAAPSAGGGKQPPAVRRQVRCLILTPTRELAAQVEESVRVYGKYLTLKSTVIFGGVGQNPQVNALRQGVDILVATPGRLLDLHQQGLCNLANVEILVLDEADRMLDMGFVHDIKKILAILPVMIKGKPRQNLLYSATFSDDIKVLADKLLNAPQMIEVARRNTTAETISQKIHFVDRERKRDLLTKLIKDGDWKQVLVFSRTKHGANRLAEQLTDSGVSALAIHGNKSQTHRTRALSDFKAGTLRVLVATDIAARGIDIDQLPHVVNYDLPNVSEDYVHRIGRTGRAGSNGEAISLVTVDETNFLADIERLIKQRLPREVIAGFEADMNVPPEPVSMGRQILWGAPKPRGWVAPPSAERFGRGGQKSGGQRPGGQRAAAPRSAPRPGAPAAKPAGSKPTGAKPSGPRTFGPKPTGGAPRPAGGGPRPPSKSGGRGR